LPEAGTTSVWPDNIMPPPSNFFLPFMVENKLACCFELWKVLKDIAPSLSNFFSQYSINLRFEVPETVWNFIKSDKIFKVSGNTWSIMLFCVAI